MTRWTLADYCFKDGEGHTIQPILDAADGLSGRNLIAFVVLSGARGIKRNQRHAALIAAAPELLYVCQRIMFRWDMEDENSVFPAHGILHELREAIAHATQTTTTKGGTSNDHHADHSSGNASLAEIH